MTRPSLPPAVDDALKVWIRHHDELAPGLISGLYLVGSAALDNWQPSSDIDIVAFTANTPSDAQVEALRSAHAATVEELGAIDIDGPRLAWADVTRSPTPIVRPWTLHGDFHNDDGCFDINPVIWYTLATYGLAVRGPAVGDLDIHIDAEAMHKFVQGNTAGYWRSNADSILRALEDPDRLTFDADLTSWSVLGIARMLFTARTGDVTSKTGAGTWLLAEMPEHRKLIEHALAIRHSADAPPDGRQITAETAAFVHDIADLVQEQTLDR